MTSLIVDENLRERATIAGSTTDFLSRQVEDAKRALDEQDANSPPSRSNTWVSCPVTSTTTCAC